MDKRRRVAAPSTRAREHVRSRASIMAWLDGRLDFERTPPNGGSRSAFDLRNVRRLLKMLGSPHERNPVAHVAGTKGKGSTVAMLAEILAAAGHRVGRYTSPHVHQLEERICVAGKPIQARDLTTAFDAVIPAVERLDQNARAAGRRGPTWFEIMTAAAFVHFARVDVDIVVLETGLGGRLDATNICDPLVSVITSISLDHMSLLGPTIGRIATEKAGIIKRGRTVVSGAVHPSARRVIAATAARRRSPLLQLGRDFHVSWQPSDTTNPLAGSRVEISPPSRLASTPIRATLTMAGRHQADNAALAAVAALRLDTLGIRVPHHAIEHGLERARLPARIETVGHSPTVVVDAAHNVASMQSLIDTLAPLLDQRRGRVLVFAASGDKQVERMLAIASGRFDTVVVTRYATSSRGAPVERLVEACRRANVPEPHVAATPREALRLAKSCAGRNGLVCVAGSFFLAAELGIHS